MTDTEEYFLIREVKKIADLEKEIKELREEIAMLKPPKYTYIPLWYPQYPTYPEPQVTWCSTSTNGGVDGEVSS